MSVTKRVTVNAKITEEESEKLNRLAERENISITALIRLLIDALINSDIELEKGEIKSCPTHDEIRVSEDDFLENLRYKELKLDKLVMAFEKQCYPDQYIRQQVDEMIGRVINAGRFNAKRGYDSDYGC